MTDTDDLSGQLEQQVLALGNAASLAEFFELHRRRLVRMVSLRMDRRLQGRVDAADVLQDAFLEASSRLAAYLREPDRMPLFLWLRTLTHQKLLQFHRHHLERGKRDAKLEVSMFQAGAAATSAVLAAKLVGEITSPSQAAIRRETEMRVRDALDEMKDIDREILALRHFEQLSAIETARVLDIDESAASKRYLRALKRLSTILRDPESEGNDG